MPFFLSIDRTLVHSRRWLRAAAWLAFALTVSATALAAPPTPVTLAVGGQGLFYYLPLTIAAQRGYFADAGLAVEIVDFPGGAKSLQAVMGGSAEVAAGSFEHVVNMHARGQALQAFVLLARYPGMVLALKPALAARYRSPRDLRGAKVGVTAPGSSTHLFLQKLLAVDGLAAAEVPVIGVGAGAGAIAALERGGLDALVHLDPVMNQLERRGSVAIAVDTRTMAGVNAVYGGPYHAACLYAKAAWLQRHAKTAQALADAQVRALRWLVTASVDDIMNSVPPAHFGGNRAAWRAALEKNRDGWSPDGRLDHAGAERVVSTLAAFEPFLRGRTIDVTALIADGFIAPAPDATAPGP